MSMDAEKASIGTLIKIFIVGAVLFCSGLLAGAWVVEQDNTYCAPALNHCMGSLNMCVGTLENCSGYLQGCVDILEASQ
jgi:hypothetical protein